MKIESKLARAFRAVATSGEQLETTASAILAIVKSAKALTVARFDKLVEAAYEANGWNTRPGRPSAGEEPKGEVPGTVRTYVTIVRRAMRERIKVAKFPTFTALRTELEAKEGGARARPGRGGKKRGRNGHNVLRLPAPVAQSFVDVEIEKPELNGAVFHDLGVVYAKLPTEHQSMLGRQLNKLLHKYLPLAKGVKAMTPAAPQDERKAA